MQIYRYTHIHMYICIHLHMRILYKICIHVYIYIWVDMGEWRDGCMDPDILIDLDMIQLQNAVDIDVHRLMDEI